VVSRLVLGCGSLVDALVEDLRSRPGSLQVLCADEARVERLREDGIEAVAGDPTAEASILEHADSPDVVAVFHDDAERCHDSVTATRTVLPEVTLVASLGRDPTPGERTAIEGSADRVVDPVDAVATHVLERVGGENGSRSQRLQRTLRSIDESLAIVTHDNPDPDAIASAVALTELAERVGLECEVVYYGEISHQENRAFVNVLDLELTNLDDDVAPDANGIALVDHARPSVNDQLPPDTAVDVLIDHHPPRGSIRARFADVRTDVGSTSTILVDHLSRLGHPIDETLATALLYGVRIDTDGFTREVSVADYEAVGRLITAVDESAMSTIESPSVSAATLETLARAVRNREVRGRVLTAGVGPNADRDAIAQAADRLLDLEDVETTLVYGYTEETIFASARARGAEVDLGETLRAAFDRIGNAGGHVDMAGAQIPMGLLGQVGEDESVDGVVRDVVEDRFYEALADRPSTVATRYGSVEVGSDFTHSEE
jgi:nanoRNase/pAp phosphatase (c-di-AMP/oligoRNAs hydrolase)